MRVDSHPCVSGSPRFASVLAALCVFSCSSSDSKVIDGSVSDASALDASAAVNAGSDQTLTIRFRATLGDEPFDCNANYHLPKFGWVEPRELKFYVMDVSLIDRDGHEVPVRLLDRPPGQSSELALLAFDTEACGGGLPETFTSIQAEVPRGDYRGIVFSNGVPESLNHADPLTLGDPLRVASMYWDWFQGFKFMAAEFGPAYDADHEEGDVMPPAQSILHVGSVGCGADASMNVKCEIANRNRVRLSEFDPDSSVIVADLAAVFAVDDPKTQTFCHGGRASCAQVYRNVGIDLMTGEAIDTQSVFRVE